MHVLCKWYALWCFVLLTRELCYYYFYYCEDLIFSPSDSSKNTSVSVVPSSSVLEGSSVTLICSSDGNPAVNYTLSRENEGELEQLQTGDTLTFNRTDPTHRGRYHCTAQNQHGSHNSSVMLDIQCEYYKTTIQFYLIKFISTLKSIIKWKVIRMLRNSARIATINFFMLIKFKPK